MLTGLRGVGKTVLLEEFRSRAEEQGWVAAFVEAGATRPFRLLAAQSLTSALRATSLRHRSSEKLRRALGVFKAFSHKASPDGSISIGIDVDPELGRARTLAILSWTSASCSPTSAKPPGILMLA